MNTVVFTGVYNGLEGGFTFGSSIRGSSPYCELPFPEQKLGFGTRDTGRTQRNKSSTPVPVEGPVRTALRIYSD